MILLVLFTTELASCQQKFDITKIKDEVFKKYISTFQVDSFPFSTYEEMYCRTRIDTSLIKRFVCYDELCLKDWSGYEIDFSPCKILPSNGEYVI